MVQGCNSCPYSSLILHPSSFAVRTLTLPSPGGRGDSGQLNFRTMAASSAAWFE
jgi:hypothetical protein